MTISNRFNTIKPLISIMLFVITFFILYYLYVNPLRMLFVALKMDPYQVYRIATMRTIAGFSIYNLLFPCILLVGAWICIHYFEKEKLSSIGIAFDNNSLSGLLQGALLGFALMTFIFTIEIIFKWIDVIDLAFFQKPLTSILMLTYIYLIKCMWTAIIEELCNRGYLFTRLEKVIGLKYSVIATSIFFALCHIQGIMNTSMPGLQIVMVFITLFLLGLTLNLGFFI